MFYDYTTCFREECGITCRKCISLRELEGAKRKVEKPKTVKKKQKKVA